MHILSYTKLRCIGSCSIYESIVNIHKYICASIQPVLFLFQAFYYDLDKVRLLRMR